MSENTPGVREAADTVRESEFPGPWKVTGPWHHDTGYPRTWSVQSHERTLADCPTEEGARQIVRALAAAERADTAEREAANARDYAERLEKAARRAYDNLVRVGLIEKETPEAEEVDDDPTLQWGWRSP